MKKLDSTNLKPCTHMQVLISAHIDSMLPGIADWYTKKHIEGCKQCQSSLPFLNSLKERLHVLNDNDESQTLPPERLAAIEDNLRKIDCK
jgi:hypothetical protein